MKLLLTLLTGAALILLPAYLCYRIAFYVPPRKEADPKKIDIPQGEIYQVFREQMEGWIREARALPQEMCAIRSFDGLALFGKFYEFAPDAPIELMFHGYRGNAERDLSGGVQRCRALGHAALIVDQRASRKSEGNTITMGIKEYRDCLDWIAFLREKFGEERKIILTGISMGAATVMMAADKGLPGNVAGILADCGYTSPKEIICTVLRRMKLPVGLVYPLVRLGARLYGRFDPEETSAVEAMKHCPVPVIFFHGEADDYVPCGMSRDCFDACTAPKKLVTVPGAGHGLSYPVDPQGYLDALRAFFPE